MERDTEFSEGKPCKMLPHTRARAKPLLLYNYHLYCDTNVPISKTGTHYFKCIESIRGCPATAHTKVVDGQDFYFKEMPNGFQHTCERGKLHLHAVNFALEVYEKCATVLDSKHPSLHTEILNKFRNVLETEGEKDQFDNIISDGYSYKSMKTTMGRRRIEILGPEPKNHGSCDFSSYPDVAENVVGVSRGEAGSNTDIWLFSSLYLIQVLTTAKVLGVDCTFKLTRHMWYQTCVILCYINGYWIPIFWALLPNKELFTYNPR